MSVGTIRIAVTLIALAAVGCTPLERLPVWAELPEFSLSDQDAQPFGTAELSGQVWVADFVFTRCPGRCPLLTRKMKKIQEEVRTRGWEDVRLVSISVDPEHDTPGKLTEYANRHGADGSLWRFLTGSRESVWSLSVKGFKLAVAEIEDTGAGPILHSNKFVLADRSGRIRGYYDAMDDEQWSKLIRDLDSVRAETAIN